LKKILYICSLAIAFSACQSSPKETQNIVTPTPNGVPTSTSAAPSTAVQQSAASGERPANNPAHGQPFHDCALPVGAPLNAKNTATPAAQAPVAAPAVQQQAPTTNTNKEVKLNPPHGQPGHDCKVSVGAPLT